MTRIDMNRDGLTRRATTTLLAGAAASFAAPAVHAQSPVKLNFWDMIWGPPEYIDTAKELVTQFNREHPAVQVEYRSVPWSGWYQTYVTAIGAGSAPDISTGAGFQAVHFFEQEAILPVDDVIAEMKASGELAEFLHGSIETLQYKGATVALPWALDVRAWLYRKDILEQKKIAVPTSWAELRAAAKACTGDGVYGLISSGDTGGSHYLYNAMNNNGGGMFSPERKADILNPINVEALKLYADMVADGSVSPASVGASSDDRRRAFTQGRCAFLLDGPGFIASAGAAADKMGVIPPMAGPRGQKGTVYWVNNIMIYKQTRYPAQTKIFMKWWSKNQAVLWTKGNARPLPARKSIADLPIFKSEAARLFIMENYLPIAKTLAQRASGTFPQLNEIEGEGAIMTMVQRIWQGQDLIKSMTDANNRLKEIIGA